MASTTVMVTMTPESMKQEIRLRTKTLYNPSYFHILYTVDVITYAIEILTDSILIKIFMQYCRSNTPGLSYDILECFFYSIRSDIFLESFFSQYGLRSIAINDTITPDILEYIMRHSLVYLHSTDILVNYLQDSEDQNLSLLSMMYKNYGNVAMMKALFKHVPYNQRMKLWTNNSSHILENILKHIRYNHVGSYENVFEVFAFLFKECSLGKTLLEFLDEIPDKKYDLTGRTDLIWKCGCSPLNNLLCINQPDFVTPALLDMFLTGGTPIEELVTEDYYHGLTPMHICALFQEQPEIYETMFKHLKPHFLWLLMHTQDTVGNTPFDLNLCSKEMVWAKQVSKQNEQPTLISTTPRNRKRAMAKYILKYCALSREQPYRKRYTAIYAFHFPLEYKKYIMCVKAIERYVVSHKSENRKKKTNKNQNHYSSNAINHVV